MRRIIEIDDETARVQPGVVLADLNRQLARRGRTFGPDPATRSVTTMGSVAAIDAAGSHWLQYGSARRHIESLEVILADGERIRAAEHDVPVRMRHDESAEQGLVRRLAGLLERDQQTIVARQPKSWNNRCGYHLLDVLEDNKLNLGQVLVGSEGTLALTTELMVNTVPLPPARGVALLFFDRLETAARGALALSNMGVSACDMMDRRLLSIARETDVNFELLIPAAAEAMLLVEVQGQVAADVREQLRQIVVRLQRRKRLAFDARMTLEPDERNLFWRISRRVIPTLYRLHGADRPVPFVEDVAVPPEAMPDFLVRLQNILKTNEVTASVFSHAGHGQLHIRPFLDLSNPVDVAKLRPLADHIYEDVLNIGGTISGEHGVGLSRTAYVQKQYGPLYDTFREVKRIFDPQHIFNPGKVVAARPHEVDQDLRRIANTWNIVADSGRPNGDADGRDGFKRPSVSDGTADGVAVKPEQTLVQLQVRWSAEELAYSARTCNGCARCRTLAEDTRMCPVFRLLPQEESTPRAKANLMRAVVTGQLPVAEMESDEFKRIADLCINCKQCADECPAGVDIPKLMLEAKAQYVATNGLRPGEWLLSRPELISSVGSRLSPLTNWAIGNRFMRWLGERMFGIAQGRKVPKFARRNFIRQAQRRRLNRPNRSADRKVLYFVDVFANWHDVEIAESLIAILKHNGVATYVPTEQMVSGMALLSRGSIQRAKAIAAANVQMLADAVRQGYHIVTTEPSATLCLKSEYIELLEDEDAQLVADHTSDACEYLWKMHQAGKLELDLKPINATLGYHLPCHTRALGCGAPAENLLRLIPGIQIYRIDKGCSGMAGTYGLMKKNYRNSLRMGWGLISALREPTIQVGTTECASCKMQMEQGTSKPTIHPLKIMALSYGLKPEYQSLLTVRGQELILT